MEIEEIKDKIQKAGGSIYLVGGAVRDEILGRPVKDKDYCITGISAEKFEEMFPMAKKQGKFFGVYRMNHTEFALARIEKKTGEGHRNFEIRTGEDIRIEEDLKRRDMTINAMARNLQTGELIDPFGGREDIQRKRIRATSKHFVEDPLRAYRVARFAAELGFTVEKETLEQMKQLKAELNSLSVERVFEELKKALKTKTPSVFFEVLKEADLLEVHLIEIQNLIGVLQPKEFHPEGDAYSHTMLALDKAAELTKREEVRFAVLVHDLGKTLTPKSEYPHHYGHEKKGVKPLETLVKRLKIPKKWESCGKTACIEHMRGGIFEKMTPIKKVKFIERVAHSKLGLEGLRIVVEADKGSRKLPVEKIRFEEIGNACMNFMNGNDIMKKYHLSSGKEVYQKLHQERIEWMKKKSGIKT